MTKKTTEISKMISEKFYDSGKAKFKFRVLFKSCSGPELQARPVSKCKKMNQ